ncbi:MAG: indole-3-glycerol-phosphate synthase [Bacteroidaceae bacterium]|nr:indole-3-glycerol-phosphate synthase [Bacteroidaceae bacterium]
MSDILHDIILHKHTELEQLCAKKPSLRQALLDSPTGIIAEFKRRSPSKGWIHEGVDAAVIPLSYQQSGAAALSILTDEHYFGGTDEDIRAARRSGVTLPILYKNFVIDEAQLYAALYAGASAVLLIAACLTRQHCQQLIAHAHALGLEVLLEMHSEQELAYAELGPDLCGINNRNLGTFTTDVENSFRLADRLREVGSASVLVSESGISNPATVAALRQVGFRGFLIGETFMKTADPAAALASFIHQFQML